MFRPGSIGRDLPGFHTRLDRAAPGVSEVVNTFYSPPLLLYCAVPKVCPGAGELCMRGRNVFMGYLGAEEKTREAFDSDGWHHSGDVGTVDEDGFYTITGRIKGTVTQYPAEAILVIFGRISGCRGFC